MKRLYWLVCLMTLLNGLNAQKESYQWHFGYHCALNFSTTPPSTLSSQVFAAEGSASVADTAGNLLFYTSGDTIWNSAHAVMANGAALLGSKYASQPCLIVKKPLSNFEYYVFTLDQLADTNGFRYSIVNMTLAAGLGSVTAKNLMIYRPAVEKLCAVRHANGQDVWIVTHEFNTNNFRSYLLTSSGLNMIPVISSIGPVHGPSTHAAVGCMKASANGRKIGLALSNVINKIELYDFNNSNGIVFNQLSLAVTAAFYGCEFSPDGTKFYGSALNSLFQWDLCAGNDNAILASQYSVAATPYQMQLGPDGKIYVATNTDTLGVVNNPNGYGSACNYNNNALPIGSNSSYGMPNFLNGYFKNSQQVIGYAISPSTCGLVTFTSPCMSAATHTSVLWNFGDLSSGSNTSSVSAPAHTYSTTGTYTVQLITYSHSGADTSWQPVSVIIPTLTISGKDTVCFWMQPIWTLTAAGAPSYSWSTGSTSATMNINSAYVGVTTYTVWSVGTCPAAATHSVYVRHCIDGIQDPAFSQLSIFPNPFSTHVSVELPGYFKVTLSDATGRVLHEYQAQNKLSLNTCDIQAGIYFITVKSKQKSQFNRLLKLIE